MRKKTFFTLGIALLSFLLVPVHSEAAKQNEAQKQESQKKEQKSAPKKMSHNEELVLWAKFDSLSIDQQKELIAIKRARIERKDSIAAAKRMEYEQKCKKFDKMTIAEQRALLETREKTPAPKSEEQIKMEEAKRQERMAQRAAQRKSDSTAVRLQPVKYKGQVLEMKEK